jgi:hypothetical protein
MTLATLRALIQEEESMRAKVLTPLVASVALSVAGSVSPAAAACEGFWPANGPVPAASSAVLHAASARGPSSAWAVGTSDGGTKTLIVRWNGSTWSAVPAPSPGEENVLTSVSAVSSTDVWAAGISATPLTVVHEDEPLLLHWDGSAWTEAPFIEGALPLVSVKALAADDVWVGGELVFLAHYDGISWVPVPHPDLEEGAIHAIDASGPNDVWFVGVKEAEGGAGEFALVERWDGVRISVVESPPVGLGEASALWGVEVISPTDVWAVGDRGDEGANQTLIEHWDGAEWTIVPSPNPGTDFNELSAVAAVAPDDVYAAGTYSTAGIEHPLVVHWDGSSWTQLRVGEPASGMATLKGIAVAGPGRVFAVGGSGPTGDDLRPLIERSVRCS